MTRPVGVVNQDGRIVVVCEDGAVYRSSELAAAPEHAVQWELLATVPGSEADQLRVRSQQGGAGGMRWIPAR